MADMIDVILASGLSSRGQIKTYAQMAAKAVADSQEAVTIATQAADNIEAITEQTNANNENAEQALQDAQNALDQVNNILDSVSDAASAEIDKLLFRLLQVHNSTATIGNLLITYPNNTVRTVNEIIKLYTSTGNNVDGGMTQKAITDALNSLNTTIINNYNTLNTRINNINISGGGNNGVSNLGITNDGKIVIVGPDGNIIAGSLKENTLIATLLSIGEYNFEHAVGVTIDYSNKTVVREQEATIYSAGNNFNQYKMYGGRMRCNVNDAGEITAFYGDSNYKDDGSNGQVMVYQPKFYYLRLPMALENTNAGEVIKKEIIIISDVAQGGLKIHPAFKNPNGEELEYILLPAYEGCAQINNNYDLNDSANLDLSNAKLSSIANAKPITGNEKTFNITTAEQMAKNRGDNWHILNLQAISVNQMLGLVEYGTLNGQLSIGKGISDSRSSANTNCSALTGSTANLGNATGSATTTTITINNNTYTETTNGRVAISYRGFENPWGNIWYMIGGLNVYGNGTMRGGIPYICTDFNYTPEEISSNYESIGFMLPNAMDWISALGYGTEQYDWVFLPIECNGGNSALPVGDNIWTTQNLNGVHIALMGGLWNFGDNNGPFYYAFDRPATTTSKSYSARLMCVPDKNSIHDANYQLWLTKIS